VASSSKTSAAPAPQPSSGRPSSEVTSAWEFAPPGSGAERRTAAPGSWSQRREETLTIDIAEICGSQDLVERLGRVPTTHLDDYVTLKFKAEGQLKKRLTQNSDKLRPVIIGIHGQPLDPQNDLPELDKGLTMLRKVNKIQVQLTIDPTSPIGFVEKPKTEGPGFQGQLARQEEELKNAFRQAWSAKILEENKGRKEAVEKARKLEEQRVARDNKKLMKTQEQKKYELPKEEAKEIEAAVAINPIIESVSLKKGTAEAGGGQGGADPAPT
jgi:hypothetical protein